MRKFTTFALACVFAASALAGDNVPWSQDFAAYNTISKWPNAKGNSSTRSIIQSSGGLYLSQSPSGGSRANDYYLWFTENGFNFEAGKSYRFDIDSRTNSDNGEKYFEILLYKKGTAKPAIADAHTSVMKVDKITQNFLTYSAYFEPTETGEYYLCLHAYCNYDGRALYWDNFKLVEASMDAPEQPGLAVTADPSGILKTNIEVTCPTRSIRGNDISSLTKLVVYRDGGVIKEVQTPAVGSKLAITDYVAQPGTHVYSAVAYNEYNAGAQADYTLTVGTEVLNNTYLYKAQYTPEKQMRIVWPAKDGVTTYQVATTSGRVLTDTPTLDEETNTYSLVDTAFELGTEPNGWQYVVSEVKEDETTALLGNTNYIALNNEIPYYPAMNMQTSLNGFTLDQDRQYGWQYYAGGGGSVGVSISRDYSTKVMYNDWLVSPGLKLKKDKFYRVKLTACSDNGVATYTIKAGKGNYRDAFDITVAEEGLLVKGGSNLDVVQTDEMFLSVPEDGMYFVGLMGKIPDNVNSDALRIKRFDIIEVDGSLPNAPTDVEVAYSATGGNDGKISFKVPEKAINGADVAGLTKVEIYKDGVLFKTITEGVAPGAVIQFDVEVTPGVQNVYTMMAFNAAGQGEPAMAKVLVLSTPYSNNFNAKNSLDGYTRINLLNTSNNFEVFNGRVRLFPNDNGNDHWLITPPVTLQKGMYYILTFNAKSKADDAGNLDVMLGKGADPAMLTQRVMETIPLDKADNIYMGNREEYFTVEEDGQYFLGFHFTREAKTNISAEVYLDDLSISAGVNGLMPDRGVLEVVPAADGSLKAELIYTAATNSLNGDALNANSTQDVYFYINGVQTPAGRTYKAYPGQKVAVTVDVPEELPYIFSARTGWAGRASYKDAFVGINRPSYPDPDKIVLKETHPYGHLLISWEAPTVDYEGYPLNPDLLTYDLNELKFDMYGNPYEDEVKVGIVGTSYEFDAVAQDDPQTMKRYVIRARNSKNEGSSGVITPYVNVGKPYRMPYRESFVNERGAVGLATAAFDETVEGMCRWGLMTDGLEGFKSADNDGAYIALESLNIDSKGRLYTGKVNLGSGLAPSLTMMVYNHSKETRKDENLLEFRIYTYGDGKWHSLGEPRSVDEICHGNPGWNKVTVDLTDYTDNVAICTVEATCKSHTFTSIDNIRIWEFPVKDVTLQSHNAPVSVIPGATFDIDVVVANSGREDALPESVEMYVDGEKAVEAEGKEIKAGETAVFTLSHSFPAVDLAESHELSFKVNYEEDQDATDNESAVVTVLTVESGLAPVENVVATSDDNRIVTLTWDAPAATESGVKTESFEDWTAGSASQHGWTSFDGDGRGILGINDGTGQALVIPGLPSGEPASFAVIDNAEGPLPATAFPAATGSKFLMSICPGGDTDSADDWMISPELSGKAQTIKFKVLNFPKYRAGYEVLCSDGDMNLNSFKSVARDGVFDDTWQEISVDVPEGTKRVALRNISYCETSFMLMIDDITYEGAGTAADELKGYNVYKEAECLASPETTGYQFAEAMEPGTYVFGVSARYAKGESAVVPVEVEVTTSGIRNSLADGVHVFGGTGCIHVTGAQGMIVTVCDLGGAVLCQGEIAADGRIAAAAGVYAVHVDGKSYKVMVK